MRIGIYVNNENIAAVDCTDLRRGNPGIGGTEYCILLLAQIFKESFPEESVVLFVARNSRLPRVDQVVVVEKFDMLCDKVRNAQVDMLVISAVHEGKPLSSVFFAEIENKQIKTILWGHNFYLNDFCNKVAKCSAVKANVFVGRQQYDRYVDHKVIRKSTYIYNMYPMNRAGERRRNDNHSVTYIGSLVPTKGFHVLAAVWKDILKCVPDAELNIIGSGKLYGRNSKLGRYNIADEEYEASFMPGLIDEKGNVLPSVHFLGVLGTEKNEIIQRTCVGVVNPTGRTETFGISALDFESQGVPVVTIAKGGFLDTVIDGQTGLLYGNTADLATKVTQLLQNEVVNEQYGRAGIELSKQFAPERIIKKWNELFHSVMEDVSLPYQKPDSFFEVNLKKYRILNRKIKDAIKIEYPMSVIGVETLARKILRRLGR